MPSPIAATAAIGMPNCGPYTAGSVAIPDMGSWLPATLTVVGVTSILDLLCEHAGLQGEDTAVTYLDYEQDWAGVVILTTSPVADAVGEYVKSQPCASPPVVMKVDLLDLDARPVSAAEDENPTDIAYLPIHIWVDPPAGRCHDVAPKPNG